MRVAGFFCIASAILFSASNGAVADEFFFKPGDRIVFLGDSITEQYDYTNQLEYYLVTRFPTWDLTIYNAGIGGDTAGGGFGRATRDILSEKPTAVTINFGMNDGGYKGPDAGIYKNYIANQHKLVSKLAEAKVRVAVMATSPVEGRKRKDGHVYNETLATFRDGLKEVAAKYGAQHVDQFTPALAVLKKMEEDKAAFACFPDTVHTNSPGGLLMAHSILTGMKAPAVVSTLELDATGKVVKTERCKATAKNEDSGLVFKREDEALPMVPLADQKVLLPYLDNLSQINVYGLTVSGLDKQKKYDLIIDGKKGPSFTGEELGKGVNLALHDLGPITTQSQDVFKAILARAQMLKYRFGAFRRSAPPAPPTTMSPEDQKELGDLRARELSIVDRSLEALRKKIYETAKPVPHEFVLKPAS